MKCDRKSPCNTCKTRLLVCSYHERPTTIRSTPRRRADSKHPTHSLYTTIKQGSEDTTLSDDGMTDADGEADLEEIGDDEDVQTIDARRQGYTLNPRHYTSGSSASESSGSSAMSSESTLVSPTFDVGHFSFESQKATFNDLGPIGFYSNELLENEEPWLTPAWPMAMEPGALPMHLSDHRQMPLLHFQPPPASFVTTSARWPLRVNAAYTPTSDYATFVSTPSMQECIPLSSFP
ncbi:hypothetical protein E5Q_02334 [Mixia osmundae IAM 14324]|uniref:Zn(2)-C6 fungal-type domain-containing protein n=2 Tax=Mixia osmundae (strain CBS 9802 / IAM 14324 / JCM 22182 / KY 12970) TaxID=764103 RepID=G7DYL7_MIXOS|nr:hypothetical protein E5Q_02334 [Mixia osmundae IAM 14324]